MKELIREYNTDELHEKINNTKIESLFEINRSRYSLTPTNPYLHAPDIYLHEVLKILPFSPNRKNWKNRLISNKRRGCRLSRSQQPDNQARPRAAGSLGIVCNGSSLMRLRT